MALEAKLTALAEMSSGELRDAWQRLTGEIAPRVSPKLLRLALAWELQARALGGLSRATQQKLDQLGVGKTRTTPAAQGMRLVREWQGKAHVVTIGEDKIIRWEAREYSGLSRYTPPRAVSTTATTSAKRAIMMVAALGCGCRPRVSSSW